MQDFTHLQVWKKAHDLTLTVYRETKRYPKEELYGLVSQIRRSCASIPSNIAEGCGRRSRPELSRFLQIELSSAYELEYHLLLSRDLNLLDEPLHRNLAGAVVEVKRMIVGLIKAVQSRY